MTVWIDELWKILDTPLIARFMGSTWGQSGADRTQVGPMLAPWTLLSGTSNLIENKPLSESFLANCYLHSWHKSQWNLNQNTTIFIQENAFQNVISKITTIFSAAFQMTLSNVFVVLWSKIHWHVFLRPICQYASIGSRNGSAPKRPYAIAWTYGDTIHVSGHQ